MRRKAQKPSLLIADKPNEPDGLFTPMAHQMQETPFFRYIQRRIQQSGKALDLWQCMIRFLALPLLFGSYLAYRAARLDPVRALHYE